MSLISWWVQQSARQKVKRIRPFATVTQRQFSFVFVIWSGLATSFVLARFPERPAILLRVMKSSPGFREMA